MSAVHRSTNLAVFLAVIPLAMGVFWLASARADGLSPPANGIAPRVGGPQPCAAVGQLRLHSRTSNGKKRYVIVDENGKITATLLPTAGVQLRSFVDKQVGVTGRSLNYRAGRTPSIFVQKVTLLDEEEPIAKPAPASFAETQADYWEGATGSGARSSVRPASAQFVAPYNTVGPAGPNMPFQLPASCGDCGQCGTCVIPQCGMPGWTWVRLEYLQWWLDGVDLPPLVTTSPDGTRRSQAGVLGQEGTRVIIGNQEALDNSRSGARFTIGGWLGPARLWAMEFDYLGVEDKTKAYSASSNFFGQPILARPFFNMNPTNADGTPDPPARQDAELVAYPQTIAGAVGVQVANSFHSSGLRLRRRMCCGTFGCTDPCTHGPSGFSSIDFLIGYRYMRLKDRLVITEDLTSLDPELPGQWDINDRFETKNEFSGVELGTVWEGGRRRWTWELLTKMALGNVRQKVFINGGTTVTPLVGESQSLTGGLLAQRTNIGSYKRDEFAVVPEISATLGYRLTPRLLATFGYTFIYWSQVVRPGDQVDLDLNPDLLPPEAEPFTGPLRPAFAFQDTDFWTQGLRLGLDYRW